MPDIEQRGALLQLLTDAQSAMARLFEHRARHMGLTRPQWRVLSGLYGHGGMTQTELSELISVARSPLGKVVDKLEAGGYVERRPDPHDRRINRLFVTDAVTPLLEPTRTLLRELEEAVLNGLPEDESFVDQLKLLRDRLIELAAQELAAA
jgi:MarR family transcriptional regulator for hemolysin